MFGVVILGKSCCINPCFTSWMLMLSTCDDCITFHGHLLDPRLHAHNDFGSSHTGHEHFTPPSKHSCAEFNHYGINMQSDHHAGVATRLFAYEYRRGKSILSSKPIEQAFRSTKHSMSHHLPSNCLKQTSLTHSSSKRYSNTMLPIRNVRGTVYGPSACTGQIRLRSKA